MNKQAQTNFVPPVRLRDGHAFSDKARQPLPQRVVPPRDLRPHAALVTTRPMLLFWDDGWKPPSTQTINAPHHSAPRAAPSAAGTSPPHGRRSRTRRLAGWHGTGPAKPSACASFCRPMTRVHPGPTRSWLAPPAPLRSCSSLAAPLLFFAPGTAGFPPDAAAALPPAQTAAFFLGGQDLFFLSFGVASRLWVGTTATVAVLTPVRLFTMGRATLTP